jgi:hypothetical protein
MAISATTNFEVRTSGNNANGGGFVPGSSGTDYSQQDSAQYSGTDLVVDATTNTKVTSATHSFVAADVGNIIHITAGTGWTVDFYQIMSVASGAATLDRSPAATSTTGGTYAVGGALGSLGGLPSTLPASSIVWVKAGGGYTISSGIVISNGASLSNILPCRVIGYSTSRGDAGRVTITASAAITMVTMKSSATIFENFILDGANIATIGLYHDDSVGQAIRGSMVRNVIVKACTTRGIDSGTLSLEYCLVTGMKSGATCGVSLRNTPNRFRLVFAVGNPCPGFSAETQNSGTHFQFCISANNTGSSSDGAYLSAALATSHLNNCVFYNNGRDGVRQDGSYQAHSFVNCIFALNGGGGSGGYGLKTTMDWNSVPDFAYDYNAFGGGSAANVSGARSGVTAGTHDILLTDDPFVNGGGSVSTPEDVLANFALKNTGGGLQCRGAGFPSYIDIGTIQHQETGGSSVQIPSSIINPGSWQLIG